MGWKVVAKQERACATQKEQPCAVHTVHVYMDYGSYLKYLKYEGKFYSFGFCSEEKEEHYAHNLIQDTNSYLPCPEKGRTSFHWP